MALLKIARLGNPILRQVSKPVDLDQLKSPGSEVQTLIEDMITIALHHPSPTHPGTASLAKTTGVTCFVAPAGQGGGRRLKSPAACG